jgi:photosystem II stability/assembly factor-like uncharacterized protein
MTVLANGIVFLTASTNDGVQPEPKLFKSTDNGSSWTNVPMSGISSSMEIPVDITNTNGVLVMSLKSLGSTTGQIYYSNNDGSSWTASNSPALAWNFYENNNFTKDESGSLYLIGSELAPSGIKLFKSTDDGKNWTALSNTGLGNMWPNAILKTSGPFLLGGAVGADGALFSSAGTVGIAEHDKIRELLAFPNPSQGILTITSENGKEIKRIEVINLNGEIVYMNDIPSNKIDLTEMPQGLYILKIQDVQGFIKFERIVISR